MNCNKPATLIFPVCAATAAVLTAVNLQPSLMQIWFVVNILLFAVPLAYTLFHMKNACGGIVVAGALWLPAGFTAYMLLGGQFGQPNPFWHIVDYYIMLAYPYFIGSQGNLCPVSSAGQTK